MQLLWQMLPYFSFRGDVLFASFSAIREIGLMHFLGIEVFHDTIVLCNECPLTESLPLNLPQNSLVKSQCALNPHTFLSFVCPLAMQV